MRTHANRAKVGAIRLESQQDNARSHTAPRRARSVKSRQLDGYAEAGQAMRQTPADKRAPKRARNTAGDVGCASGVVRES
ncbi:hypothetical protein MRX96_007105 [Rhipicephalus microplus]